MHIDLDIIFYAIIAAVLIGRLWSVLGTRNEDDPQRPNPFIPSVSKPEQGDASFTENRPSPFLHPMLPPESLAGGLAQIKEIDANFDERQFLREARSYFVAIVESYAKADMGSLTALVSSTLLAHFQKAAEARHDVGQSAQTKVLIIKEAEAVAARADGTKAYVTVRFVSDQENILRNSQGIVIGGTEGKGEEVTDVWTFARETQTPDAKWLLVETRG